MNVVLDKIALPLRAAEAVRLCWGRWPHIGAEFLLCLSSTVVPNKELFIQPLQIGCPARENMCL